MRNPSRTSLFLFFLSLLLCSGFLSGCAILGGESRDFRSQAPTMPHVARGALLAPASPLSGSGKIDSEVLDVPPLLPKMVLRDTVEARNVLRVYVSLQREDTEEILRRRARYLDMIESVLRDFDLPLELSNLAFVESKFQPEAKSSAGAVGLWQLMKTTAQSYGLKVSFFRDERKDEYKSTVVAIRHLSELYDHFDDWFLALAAYNAGRSKIDQAVLEGQSRDFFSLVAQGVICRETDRFVSKFIATTILTRNLDVYGFEDGAKLAKKFNE